MHFELSVENTTVVRRIGNFRLHIRGKRLLQKGLQLPADTRNRAYHTQFYFKQQLPAWRSSSDLSVIAATRQKHFSHSNTNRTRDNYMERHRIISSKARLIGTSVPGGNPDRIAFPARIHYVSGRQPLKLDAHVQIRLTTCPFITLISHSKPCNDGKASSDT